MWIRDALKFLGLLVLWYLTSVVTVMLSKALFLGKLGSIPAFEFPLTVTFVTKLICFGITQRILKNYETFSFHKETNRYELLMGTLSAGEIGLKSLALNELSVTLYTMMKGTAPLLILAWGVAFGIYRFSSRLLLVVLSVTVGLSLAVSGQGTEQRDNSGLLSGVLFYFIAAIFSGLRWVIAQIFIKGDTVKAPGWIKYFMQGEVARKLSPLSVILHTAPYTMVIIFPLALCFEGENLYTWISQSGKEEQLLLALVSLVIGVCALLYIWSGYALVRQSSSLTVSIGSIAKEMIIIGCSILLLSEHLTFVGIFGFTLVHTGIVVYGFLGESQLVASGESTSLIGENNSG